MFLGTKIDNCRCDYNDYLLLNVEFHHSSRKTLDSLVSSLNLENVV